MSFNGFGLDPSILERVAKLGFQKPTPIQVKSIPSIIKGKDLVAMAPTGTGKTAAFTLPMLHRLSRSRDFKGLVLVPTRELADQVVKFIRSLDGQYKTRVAHLIGGVSFFHQIKELKNNPQIIVATPGRLIDHINEKRVNLSLYNMVVVDEADRMFDIGFAPQIKKIFQSLPKSRQTLLFSATYPDAVKALFKPFVIEPEYVTVGSPVAKVAEKIDQKKLDVRDDQKKNALYNELAGSKGLTLVFTRTKHRADHVAKFLVTSGFAAVQIHGGKSQNFRRKALEGFKTGEFQVLVATDVASRGIDVPLVAKVINFDLPETSDDYIHRVGRTGRAGASGLAVSLVSPNEQRHWQTLIKAAYRGAQH